MKDRTYLQKRLSGRPIDEERRHFMQGVFLSTAFLPLVSSAIPSIVETISDTAQTASTSQSTSNGYWSNKNGSTPVICPYSDVIPDMSTAIGKPGEWRTKQTDSFQDEKNNFLPLILNANSSNYNGDTSDFFTTKHDGRGIYFYNVFAASKSFVPGDSFTVVLDTGDDGYFPNPQADDFDATLDITNPNGTGYLHSMTGQNIPYKDRIIAKAGKGPSIFSSNDCVQYKFFIPMEAIARYAPVYDEQDNSRIIGIDPFVVGDVGQPNQSITVGLKYPSQIGLADLIIEGKLTQVSSATSSITSLTSKSVSSTISSQSTSIMMRRDFISQYGSTIMDVLVAGLLGAGGIGVYNWRKKKKSEY